MRGRSVALFVACGFFAIVQPGLAKPPADDPLGEAALLAGTCSGCHGDAPDAAIASLSGRSADEIAEAFQRYKTETDGPSAMHRMAWGYTDEQIRLIAEYLAQQ